MDPRRVLTFRTVAHEQSFSRAARSLSLSQPSVSNQVASLERELGIPHLALAAPANRERLRIGAFPTALAGLVPAAIANLRLQHPDIRVTVEEGATDDLPARVRTPEPHVPARS